MSDGAWEEVVRLLSAVLRLEGERLVAAISIGRVSGATPEAVEEIDDQIGLLLSGLDRRGVKYPGHTLAAQYGLSGGGYAVLQLALLPHHAPDLLRQVLDALGDEGESVPRMRHAQKLFGSSAQVTPHFRRMLESQPVCRKRLLELSAKEVDSPLRVSKSVLELLGLSRA